MRAARTALLALVLLTAFAASLPAAEATSCLSAPPACPVGSIPYPKRQNPPGCSGSAGITWSCAWIW